MEVPSYFREYLHKIQPTTANRQRAIQLHTTLRDRLAGAGTLEDWYAGSFLYGSYRRNTAVQPIKDVDICVLLDIESSAHSPQTVVNCLREVLEEIGYEAKTALQRRSVRIDMSSTTLDVVPVVAAPDLEEQLLIPDRALSIWVPTHPKGHLEAAIQLNKESAKRYVPLVKIVKAWHRYQNSTEDRPKPKGFTLEALVAAYQDPDAPSFAEQFVRFLDNLSRDCGSLMELGIFPSVPDPAVPVRPITLTMSDEETKQFSQLLATTLVDARAALDAEDLTASVWAWHGIFGPNFPRPRSEALKLVEHTGRGDYESGEPAGEIIEVDQFDRLVLGNVHVSVEVAKEKEGPLMGYYPSNGGALEKNLWLRFRVENLSINPPYMVRWTVVNHGKEARDADDLGHSSQGSDVHWESTKYRGTHTMTCEIVQGEYVVASAVHVVAVK